MEVGKERRSLAGKYEEFIDQHRTHLLQNLEQLLTNERLFDFTIYVDEQAFKANRVVLATSSDYFRAMFSHNSVELKSGRVEFDDLEPTAIHEILKFCYTFKLNLTDDNVQDILIAAARLRFDAIQKICVEYIQEKMDTTNCLGVMVIADRCHLRELCDKALEYFLENFQTVVDEREFLDLDDEFLTKIIAHDELDCYDELEVFHAVLKWVRADEANRLPKLTQVVSQVRFALIKPAALVELTSIDLVRKSPEVRDLIDDAKNFLLLKDEPEEQKKYTINTRPRAYLKQVQRLYAVGGWTDEYKSIASAETYNPATDKWTEIKSMAKRRCGVGLTTLGDSLYAIGGHDGQNYLNSVERYDVKLNKWFKDVADMKYPRTSLGAVSFEGCIYAIGGQVGTEASDRVERYDPVTNEWTGCAPMQYKRLGAGVAVYKNYIFVMGGGDMREVQGTVARYEPKKDIWVDVAPMKYKRKHLGSCVCQGKIFAVGGRNGKDELDSVEIYDPIKNVWSEGKPMQIKRCGIGLVELAGQIYAIGGQRGDDRLDKVEAYDLNRDTWTWRKPMIYVRLGGGMTVHPMRRSKL